MMGNDHFPYWARIGDVIHKDQPVAFGKSSELLEIPISWTLDDYPYFEFVREKSGVLPGLAAAEGVLQNWLNDFLYMAIYKKSFSQFWRTPSAAARPGSTPDFSRTNSKYG